MFSCCPTLCHAHTCHTIVLTNIVINTCETPFHHTRVCSCVQHDLIQIRNTHVQYNCRRQHSLVPELKRRDCRRICYHAESTLNTHHMRILIEYEMHVHMPTKHTQCNDKHTIFPTEKGEHVPEVRSNRMRLKCNHHKLLSS